MQDIESCFSISHGTDGPSVKDPKYKNKVNEEKGKKKNVETNVA